MVWKLLRKNISAGQIVGYSLASLIGLSIVICAVKFYSDVSSAFNDEDSFISKDYVIISKTVSTAGTIGLGGSTTFDADEIADIKAQPWVRDVGVFTAADFNVDAILNIGGRGISTQLFFEAIPDRFFDFSSDKWTFTAPAGDAATADPDEVQQIEIPVVMSKDYLTLYNFGFAAARGFPQLNERLVQQMPLKFRLAGNGHNDIVNGRVVGFSSRINTIAVPLDFIDWANDRYSPGDSLPPSRLIIEANTPGDPAIAKYLDANSYERAGDTADNSRANYFLTVAMTIVIAVGAIITILAFFILMLSIYLLLQKNKRKLHDLMLLGYSPTQVARPYFMLVGLINLTVLGLAIIVMLVAGNYWITRLDAIGIQSASPLAAILVGLCISLCVTALNCLAIRNIVRRNF